MKDYTKNTAEILMERLDDGTYYFAVYDGMHDGRIRRINSGSNTTLDKFAEVIHQAILAFFESPELTLDEELVRLKEQGIDPFKDDSPHYPNDPRFEEKEKWPDAYQHLNVISDFGKEAVDER